MKALGWYYTHNITLEASLLLAFIYFFLPGFVSSWLAEPGYIRAGWGWGRGPVVGGGCESTTTTRLGMREGKEEGGYKNKHRLCGDTEPLSRRFMNSAQQEKKRQELDPRQPAATASWKPFSRLTQSLWSQRTSTLTHIIHVAVGLPEEKTQEHLYYLYLFVTPAQTDSNTGLFCPACFSSNGHRP